MRSINAELAGTMKVSKNLLISAKPDNSVSVLHYTSVIPLHISCYQQQPNTYKHVLFLTTYPNEK